MFTKILKSFILISFLSLFLIGCVNNASEEVREIHPSFIPAVYSLDDLVITNRNQVAGGNGDLVVKYAFVRDNSALPLRIN